MSSLTALLAISVLFFICQYATAHVDLSYDFIEESEGTNVNCGDFKSCSACTPFKGCGWCASGNVCLGGNMNGPSMANCSFWDYGFCTGEPCSVYTHCYSCISDPFCGWYASSASCTEGSRDGPLFGSCAAFDYGRCDAAMDAFPQYPVANNNDLEENSDTDASLPVASASSLTEGS